MNPSSAGSCDAAPRLCLAEGDSVLPLPPFLTMATSSRFPMANSCRVLRSGRDARVAIRAAYYISTPSARWCRMGSRTPPVTEPGSWPGGLAIPRPTSAWPVAIASTFWTLTAPPAPQPGTRRDPWPGELGAAGPHRRGGWHYYLAPTGLGNARPRDLEHVDWRGRGGYVVAPPQPPRQRPPLPVGGGPRPGHPGPGSRTVLFERLQPGQLRRPTGPLQLPAAGDGRGDRYARAAHSRGAGPRRHRSDRPTQPPAVGVDPLYNLVATGALDQREVDQGLLQAAERCGLLAEEPH